VKATPVASSRPSTLMYQEAPLLWRVQLQAEFVNVTPEETFTFPISEYLLKPSIGASTRDSSRVPEN